MVVTKTAVASVLKIIFSYLILFLFQAVSGQRYPEAYFLCAILTLLWYFAQLAAHLYGHHTFLIAPKIKAGLAMFLYLKLSTIVSLTERTKQLGTVTNLITNDLSTLDERASSIAFLVPFLITIVGTSIIMVSKVGIAGMFAIALILLILPVTHFLSKFNEKIVAKLTHLKDKRIKLTAELIEGIKYIKMYGWELSFKKKIDEVSRFITL